MKFTFVFFFFFSIKYHKHKLHLRRLFCCNNTCYCVKMVSVTLASRYITSASRYHPRYQSRSSMYIRGLIPRNFAELTEAVPIAERSSKSTGAILRCDATEQQEASFKFRRKSFFIILHESYRGRARLDPSER